MLFNVICWLLLIAAFPNGVLILKNGKSLAFDEYSVEDGRIKVTHKGETYSIPESVIDWEASHKAKEARIRAQELKEAMDSREPKKDAQDRDLFNGNQLTEKRSPLNLTNDDFRVLIPRETAEPLSNRETKSMDSNMDISRYKGKISLAMGTIHFYSELVERPHSTHQQKEGMEKLGEAERVLNEVKEMLREERSLLEAKQDTSMTEGTLNPSQINERISCTFKLDQFVNEILGLNRVLMQAVQNGRGTKGFRERLYRQVVKSKKALAPADACYPGLAATRL